MRGRAWRLARLAQQCRFSIANVTKTTQKRRVLYTFLRRKLRGHGTESHQIFERCVEINLLKSDSELRYCTRFGTPDCRVRADRQFVVNSQQ